MLALGLTDLAGSYRGLVGAYGTGWGLGNRLGLRELPGFNGLVWCLGDSLGLCRFGAWLKLKWYGWVFNPGLGCVAGAWMGLRLRTWGAGLGWGLRAWFGLFDAQ